MTFLIFHAAFLLFLKGIVAIVSIFFPVAGSPELPRNTADDACQPYRKNAALRPLCPPTNTGNKYGKRTG
jgi:hypothetical protein